MHLKKLLLSSPPSPTSSTGKDRRCRQRQAKTSKDRQRQALQADESKTSVVSQLPLICHTSTLLPGLLHIHHRHHESSVFAVTPPPLA